MLLLSDRIRPANWHIRNGAGCVGISFEFKIRLQWKSMRFRSNPSPISQQCSIHRNSISNSMKRFICVLPANIYQSHILCSAYVRMQLASYRITLKKCRNAHVYHQPRAQNNVCFMNFRLFLLLLLLWLFMLLFGLWIERVCLAKNGTSTTNPESGWLCTNRGMYSIQCTEMSETLTDDGEMAEMFWVKIGLFWFFVWRSNDSRHMEMLDCVACPSIQHPVRNGITNMEMRVSNWIFQNFASKA